MKYSLILIIFSFIFGACKSDQVMILQVAQNHPNPFIDTTSITVISNIKDTISLRLTNTEGFTFYAVSYLLEKGENLITLTAHEDLGYDEYDGENYGLITYILTDRNLDTLQQKKMFRIRNSD